MPVVSGKGNRTRKTLSFFAVNFGLSPPYEVLCDGPIIFQSLRNDLYLKQSLPKLLGAPAYPVVTECVVKELRRLGDDFTNAALFAKRVKRVPCVHDGKANVAECLLSRLRNPSHTGSVLATNDPEVSKKATRIPGVAIVSILNQEKLILQVPSLATTNYVKRSQRTKIHSLSDSDRALVQEIKTTEDRLRQDRAARKKRKRAKGPNPLSVKKSKENGKTNVGGAQGATALLKTSPPDKDKRRDKADETNVELEERESSLTTNPNEDTGSPIVASGESERKLKRRRVTEFCVERGLGFDDTVNGMENNRPSHRADKSPETRKIEQRSNQIGKRKNAMGVVDADDTSLTTSRVCSGRQGLVGLPPTADSEGTEVHRCIQHLPSTTQTREQTASRNRDAPVLTDMHSEAQLYQERPCNKVSFTESKSKVNGDTSVSGQLTNQLPLTSCGGVETKEDPRAPPQDKLANTDDGQLVAMQITEAEGELADASGKRTKKHRKNRRRRPKKKTSP